MIGSIMRARSRRASVNTNSSGRGRVSSTAFNPNDPVRSFSATSAPLLAHFSLIIAFLLSFLSSRSE